MAVHQHHLLILRPGRLQRDQQDPLKQAQPLNTTSDLGDRSRVPEVGAQGQSSYGKGTEGAADSCQHATDATDQAATSMIMF